MKNITFVYVDELQWMLRFSKYRLMGVVASTRMLQNLQRAEMRVCSSRIDGIIVYVNVNDDRFLIARVEVPLIYVTIQSHRRGD
jgi:hypothetical protein